MGDDNIKNNFQKNYFSNITNTYPHHKYHNKESFMEGIEKVYVIKGFYRNFLTLKGKL